MYSKSSIKPPGAYLSDTILWVGAYSKGGLFEGGLINVTVLGSAKYNILYHFCPLKLLYHEDMTHIKHILNVDKGKGASKLGSLRYIIESLRTNRVFTV